MKKIRDEIRYWSQVFLIPLYWFSYVTPRSKKIWLFGSSFGKRFADNPRYLYLYLNQIKPMDVRPIWITHNKEIVEFLRDHKLEVYYYRSLKGIWYCLRGGVYIFDNYSKDISFWLSGGAKKVNLWHGTGNKKINYDNIFDKVRHPQNNWQKFRYALRRMSDEKPSHYVLATSQMMGGIFSSAFRVPKDHIIIDGYPRNDVLIHKDLGKGIYTTKEKKAIEEILQYKKEGKKIILYMPTFRESETKFFQVMNFEVFNDFLNRHDLIFYTKLHPKSKLKQRFMEITYSNIIFMEDVIDSYTVLGYADMLTTDYSSVYTDYLLLNRPSVLFTYDLEEYSKNTRECYFEYDVYIPELRTYNMEEFMNGIAAVLEQDLYEEGRLKLRAKMFDYIDGDSSKRLYEKIKKILL